MNLLRFQMVIAFFSAKYSYKISHFASCLLLNFAIAIFGLPRLQLPLWIFMCPCWHGVHMKHMQPQWIHINLYVAPCSAVFLFWASSTLLLPCCCLSSLVSRPCCPPYLHGPQPLILSLQLWMAVLIKRGVKSSSSRSMCVDLSCRMYAICGLTLTVPKPEPSYPDYRPTHVQQPPPTPQTSFPRHRPTSARVHGQRTAWKFCVLLSTVCFSGNRGDNTRPPHLKGTILCDSPNTYASKWNGLIWIRWWHIYGKACHLEKTV